MDLKKKVLEYIDEDELVELTKGIVRFPSYPPDETPVNEYLADYMRKNGFEVEMQEVEPGRFQHLGWLRGSGEGPSMMFNGHTDIDPMTMATVESWKSMGKDPFDPFVEDGRFYGQGVGNMKGGVAAMVIAAVALKRAKIPLKGDILITPVVGELQGGVGTYHLLKHGYRTDYALVPEPSDLKIRTFTAGVIRLLINTIGKSVWIGNTHVIKPVHAVEKMCKVIKALKNIEFTYTPKPEVPDLPRMVYSSILGGVTRDYTIWRVSYTPDFCTMGCDIRTVPSMTAEGVVNDFRKVLDPIKEEDPEFEYEIELPPDTYRDPWNTTLLVRPPCDTPVDEPIVELVRKNHVEVRGEEPEGIGAGYHLGSHAGNDTGYLSEAGIISVTYGPRNKNAQTSEKLGGSFFDEQYMAVDDMLTVAKVYAMTTIDLCT